MGYVVFCLSTLAAAFLLAANIAALTANNRQTQKIITVIVALLPFVVGTWLSIVMGGLHANRAAPMWAFAYMLFWTICYLLGSILIIRAGLRKQRNANNQPAASKWPRDKLAVTFGIVFIISAMVFSVLHQFAQVDAGLRLNSAVIYMQTRSPAWGPESRNAESLYWKSRCVYAPEKVYPKWHESGWQTFAYDPNADFMSAEIQSLLVKNEDAFGRIHQAVIVPDCNFGLDTFPTYETQREFISTAVLLGVKARTNAMNGHTRVAMENIKALRAMAEKLGRNKGWAVVASKIDDIAIMALEDVLANCGSMPTDVISLPVVSTDFVSSRIRDYINSWGVAALYKMQESGVSLNFFEQLGEFIPGLAWYNKLGPIANPFYRSFLMKSDMMAVENIIYKGRTESNGLYSAMFVRFPRSIEDKKEIARSLTNQRLAAAALAAEAYRYHTGEYPEKLADLLPKYISEIPSDPFDIHRPLKMAEADGGIVIYSVGRNGRDDRGIQKKRGESEPDDSSDIIFCLGGAYKTRRLKTARTNS